MPVTPADKIRAASKAAAARARAVRFQVKAARTLPGSVTAGVVTLNVVDRDGDYVRPGALTTPPGGAIVSAWSHRAMHGEAPVGRARLWEEGDRIMAEITFDDTPEGRRACEKITAQKPDWSVGYRHVQTQPLSPELKARGARRDIVRWEVFEVSPVDRGAGVGQGTFSACCGSCATATAGKCRVGDEPPAEDFIAPWQKAVIPRLKGALIQRRIDEAVEMNRGRQLLARLRESLARIEQRGDLQ